MKGWDKFKDIFLYSDSEPNEVLIGLLHALILPVAMLEMMEPNMLLQLGASAVGFFQLYAVLWNGKLKVRFMAVKLATLISISTVVNYCLAGMLHGSHFGWLLILVFAVWNLVRVAREYLAKQ